MLFISLLTACAKQAQKPEADDKENLTAGVMIAKVKTDRAHCMPRTPKECLNIDNSLVYDDTQGFDFEYDYEYKLKIQRRYVKSDRRTRAQRQLYTYHLIEVLDKIKID